MNRLPLFLNVSRYCYLSVILLTVVTAVTVIPVQAQSPNRETLQIAQSLTEAQKQALATKATQALQLLINKDYAQAIKLLSPQLQAKWTTERLKNIWEDTLSQIGDIKKILHTKVIYGVNANIVVITVETTQGNNKDFFVTFNPQEQVIGLNLPNRKTLTEIAEEFTYALIAKDYTEARGYLHPFLKAEVFPKQVQQKWEAMLKKTGAVKRIVDTQLRRGGGGEDIDLVLVTLQFAQGTQDLLVLFDNNKQIVGVDFPEMQ